MRLRKPCEHGLYESHGGYDDDGSVWEPCPGGEFLPEDAFETVWFCWLHKSAGIPGTYFCEMAGLPSFVDSMVMEGLDPCDPKHHRMVEAQVLKPAADQVGEPG